MSEVEGITWFKHNFAGKVNAAVAGTPLTLDLLAAIAMQESYGDAWGLVFKTRPVADVLQVCVGDTLDFPNRSSAFPKNRAELLTAPNGQAMFDIARDALIKLAAFNHGYAGAAGNPVKFCHGFGIFQYDIQFFKNTNPAFFLQKKWFDFDECLKLALGELSHVAQAKFPNQPVLTDEQLTYVAIGYNVGANHVHVGAGFKQGHEDNGVFYGEKIDHFLKLAHTIP